MEDADLMEIPPPVNWGSKPRSLKRKEVFCPEIIYVDDYEDCPHSIPVSEKYDTRFKNKQTFTELSHQSSTGTHNNASGNDVKSTGKRYEGPHYSNESYKDMIIVDDDHMGFPEIYDDQFAVLQSNFDGSDISPEFAVSKPWVTDDHGNNMNLFTGSVSSQSAFLVQNNHPEGFPSLNKSYPTPWHSETKHDKTKYISEDRHIQFGTKKLQPCSIKPDASGMIQLSSSNYSGEASRITRVPRAYDLHVIPDCGKKPLHSLKNQISTSANNFHGASMPTGNEKPLSPHEQVGHGLMSHFWTAANKLPFAAIPTGNNIGLNMNTGMSSNVDLSHKLPGHHSIALKSSTVNSYLSGVLNSSAPPLSTFFDPTALNSLFPNSMGIQKDLKPAGKFSSSSSPSCSKSVNVNPEIILKNFDLFKKFDTVEDWSDHSFSKSNAFATTQPSKSWAKKIQDEWRILEKDLPDTIFVRVYESRMDLMRAAIIGAEGTPYQDGIFFFDMFFPSNYPRVPPQVKYHSGGLRINPNLYNCGKVCLSLLNTWGGSEKEMWIPGESTVLQVLVSIQGLILNEKPYFNEPGYSNTSGTVTGEKRSLDYNEKTLIYSLKTMVYSIKNTPKHFEDLVVGHFFKRGHDILMACRAYKNGTQVGSVVVKGRVEGVNNKGQNSNSQSFKKELAGYLKTLVEAFAQVGVKDCDKFLS